MRQQEKYFLESIQRTKLCSIAQRKSAQTLANLRSNVWKIGDMQMLYRFTWHLGRKEIPRLLCGRVLRRGFGLFGRRWFWRSGLRRD